MKSDHCGNDFEEIELKLALPASDPSGLAQALGRTPVLARCKPRQQPLHNVYYDTPQQILRSQRVALRLRCVGTGAQARWLQTLKIGGASDSALSQRGEWEVAVPGPQLSAQALQDTPWPGIDPDGSVFAALAPCFVTRFERTTWLVRRRDRCLVEVALDLGRIDAAGNTAPIAELEFELRAGPISALFDVAQAIAASVAVLPLSQSKAQRGYALAQGTLGAAQRAQPALLRPDLTLPEAARQVLRETFAQFCGNLFGLQSSDEPERVHQARVGWRRFRSALRLFKAVLAHRAPPPLQALKNLLGRLGELRDLDVARTETLPGLADAYVCGDAPRAQAWQDMGAALAHAARRQRASVLNAMQQPAFGATLLAITQWLEELTLPTDVNGGKHDSAESLRDWSRSRSLRMHRRLHAALEDTTTPEARHRTRILAKRLRYSIEALRPLLRKRQAQRWYSQALAIQSSIGSSRDVLQAGSIVARLDVDPGLQEFVRGVVFATGVVTPVSN